MIYQKSSSTLWPVQACAVGLKSQVHNAITSNIWQSACVGKYEPNHGIDSTIGGYSYVRRERAKMVNLDIYIRLIDMPQKEYTQTVKIPGFVYKGFRFPEAEVAADIENLGTEKSGPGYELHQGSVTLAEAVALYELALTVKLEDQPLPKLPKETVRAALTIYENIHSRVGIGEWMDDACDYDNGKIPRGVLVPEDFVPARWVKHPVLEKEDEGRKAFLCEDSQEVYIFLPPEGFVIPTVDGLYRLDAGTPFATEKDKEKAITLLNKAGLDGEREASYFYRNDRNEGVCCVIRQHLDYYGPFTVFVSIEPSFRDEYIGQRSINRSQGPTSSQQPP